MLILLTHGGGDSPCPDAVLAAESIVDLFGEMGLKETKSPYDRFRTFHSDDGRDHTAVLTTETDWQKVRPCLRQVKHLKGADIQMLADKAHTQQCMSKLFNNLTAPDALVEH